MIMQQINCNAGHRYFVTVKTPVGKKSEPPTVPGAVTGIKVRFTTTKGGPAIDDDLDDLDVTEDADDPALFYVDVSQTLHQAHLLPLGRGKKYFVEPSKAGVTKNNIDTYIVATESNI